MSPFQENQHIRSLFHLITDSNDKGIIEFFKNLVMNQGSIIYLDNYSSPAQNHTQT